MLWFRFELRKIVNLVILKLTEEEYAMIWYELDMGGGGEGGEGGGG